MERLLDSLVRLTEANERIGFSQRTGREKAQRGAYPIRAFKLPNDDHFWWVYRGELEEFVGRRDLGMTG